MSILFEAIKLLYYLMTIGLGILYFKGNELLEVTTTDQVIVYAIPAYLIFTGVLIGYVLYEIFADHESQMSRYFIGGVLLGIALVVLSLTTGRGNFELVAG